MKRLQLLIALFISSLAFTQTIYTKDKKNVSTTTIQGTSSREQDGFVIDPIEIDPTEDDPIDLEPITTLTPNLDVTEVGNTNGGLSVSQTGGAFYTIPILLPPGINSVAPNISLNYSSQSGDGNAGFGWNIGGVSKISRVSSTLYHDGVIDPVDLDNLDKFALDGQRLILKTGNYGQVGSTYQTESYSNLKISFLANGFQTYFKVEYPDGSFSLYGYSTDTSSLLSFSEWPITQWQNPQGIKINYKYYNYSNELYIKSIDYGTSTNVGINKVEFIYKTKNKEIIYYLDSFEFKNNKILSSIKVTANNVLYRNYYLTHDLTTTGYERLKSFQEKTGDNAGRYNPILFNYEANQLSFTQELSYSHTNSSISKPVAFGDLVGDGNVEFLSNSRLQRIEDNYVVTTLKDSLSIPKDIKSSLTFLDDNFTLSNKQGWSYLKNVVGNDIKIDIHSLDESNNAVLEYSKTVNNLINFTITNVEINYTNAQYLQYGQRKSLSLYGDFDGDKLTDILLLKLENGIVSTQFINLDRRLSGNFNFNSGSFNIGAATFNFQNGMNGTGTSKIEVGDFNGDGKTDLIIFRGHPYNKIEIYSLINNQLIKIRETTYSLPGLVGNDFKPTDVPKYPITVGDYNGDGISDLLLSWEGKILYSTNNNLVFKQELLPSTFKKPISPYNEKYVAMDVNNDGKSDIVQMKAIYERGQTGTSYTIISTDSGPVQCCPQPNYSYNHGLELDVYLTNSPASSNWLKYSFQRIFINNLGPNGGHISDTNPSDNNRFNEIMTPLFVRKKQTLENFADLAILGSQGVTYFNLKRFVNNQTFLNRIDQGNGIIHEIKYKNLESGNGTYTSSNSLEVYPFYNLLNGKHNRVVSEIKESFSGFSKKQFYKYYGAIFDLSGRGISGFQATTVTNWFNDASNIISTVNTFDFTKNGAIKETFSKVGLIEPNYKLLPTDTYISRFINTYNYEDTAFVEPLLSNKVFKLFKTKTENFNAQNNTSSITLVDYNANNNPINSITTIKKGGIPEKTTSNTFNYDSVLSAPYIVDRLNAKTSTTTLSLSGDVYSSEEQYNYEVNLLKQIKKRSTNSGLISDFITENNEYDAYGNIIQKKISAPGMVSRIENYEYDTTTHRFLVKKIDSNLQETTYTYNLSTGLVLTETLPSNSGYPLKTTYVYDKWGKVLTVTNYLGKNITYAYFNISANRGVLKTTTSSDGSISKTIYDPLGRILHEGHKNLSEQWAVNSKTYNIYDQPLRVYKNYLDGDTPEVWDELQYDIYGRLIQANHLKSLSSPGKTLTYTYNNLTSTEDDGLKIKTSIKNASGQIVSLNDNPGETITYDYFANGNLKKAYLNGGVLEIQQDAFGRRKTLIDPSAGTRNYTYNKFGELIKEEVIGKGETEYDLDNNGNLLQKRTKELGVLKSISTYNYSTNKLLSTVIFEDLANSTQIGYSYNYDNYKRLIFSSESGTQFYFKKEIKYDAFGRADKELFHAKNLADNKISEKWIKNEYRLGNKYKIYDMSNIFVTEGLLWEATASDAYGNITSSIFNNGMIKLDKSFDELGFPTQIEYSKELDNLLTLDTEFDPVYGNLTKRSSNLFGSTWTENLNYDSLDRLITWKDHEGIQNQSYNNNGTINSNKIGSYAYTINNKPFQVSTVTPLVPSTIYDYYVNREQNIIYNVNKKPISINEQNAENIDFEYNAFDSRSVMYYGGLQQNKTDRPFRKYYSSDGSMEIKRNMAGAVEFYTYIGGTPYNSSIVLKSDGTTKEYLFLLKDYQGTINGIVNQAGTVIEKRQFDVWGTLIQYANNSGGITIPTTANGLLLDRGYTSHEHLLGVNIINMNGRIYDNHFHKFLQPDNNIQDFFNTQNYNRYGYVMNSPTKYTDQSGEFWQYFVGALFGAYSAGYNSSGSYNPFNWNSTAWANAGLGAASFAASSTATYYADNYISNFGNNNFLNDSEYHDIPKENDYRNGLNEWESINRPVICTIGCHNVPSDGIDRFDIFGDLRDLSGDLSLTTSLFDANSELLRNGSLFGNYSNALSLTFDMGSITFDYFSDSSKSEFSNNIIQTSIESTVGYRSPTLGLALHINLNDAKSIDGLTNLNNGRLSQTYSYNYNQTLNYLNSNFYNKSYPVEYYKSRIDENTGRYKFDMYIWYTITGQWTKAENLTK